jgi:hypothetical protein
MRVLERLRGEGKDASDDHDMSTVDITTRRGRGLFFSK